MSGPPAAFRGSSLYAGIFDPPSASTSTPPSQDAVADDCKTAKTPAAVPTAWSASLRFAPRRIAAAGKNKPRPNAAFVASLPPVPLVEEATPAPPPRPPIPVPSVVKTKNSPEATDALAIQLQQHTVSEAPPYTLPDEVLQRDRDLARKAAQDRGDIAPREDRPLYEADDQEADEDVNGFMATSAGKRAASKRKKRRKRGNSPPPGPNLDADYDPRIPNDYMAFKQTVYERRQAFVAHQRYLRDQQTTSAPPTSTLTGEEAFARRLALSTPSTSADLPPDLKILDSDLAAKKSAAAAIAARLAQMTPTSRQDIVVDDAAPFAERLMVKYGYVQGEGLGAEGNKGILEPLQHSQSRSHSTRGQIVNTNPDPKTAEEAALYGSAESSPVIVLLNMVTPEDLYREQDGQDDIIQDIAEECAKFGTVKRVFAHESQDGSDEVRVFVQFTGAAAGWKAVRALNGRWFQGRSVRALYYDPTAFDQQDLERPLLA